MNMKSSAKRHVRGIEGLAVLAILLFCGGGVASAVNMTVVSRFPASGAANVCVDTKLWMTWGSNQTYIGSGNLKICKVSDDSVVYQLNLQALSDPPVAAGWPYQISLAGKTVNYQPFAITTNLLEIHPSIRLEYNTAYYIKMTVGFCVDASGRTSPAIADSTTWRFTTKAVAPTVDHDYTVALDGTGDFCTIQGASDAVTNNDPCRTIIRIKNGTYRELLSVPSSKKNVTWLGQDKDSTIVAAFNNNNFNTSGSSYRCMVEVSASDFRMYNMTLRNTTPQGGSQAESIKVNGAQRFLAQDCKFYSYQDTLLVSGTAYFGDCYIEGDVDYIWGYGSVFFERCELKNLRTGGYINQARNGSGVPGYFFVDCKLTAPAGISGMWLARIDQAAFPYSQVVFINTIMQSGVIAAQGWNIYGSGSTANLQFWEYKSVDLSGNPVNISSRHPASRQLSDAEALYWRNPANVLGGWAPTALPDLPTAAWQPQPADGAAGDGGGVTLKWAAGAAATSHVVYFGTDDPPSLVGEQTATSLATGVLIPGVVYNWRVNEKNAAGTTTGQVWSFTAVTDGIPPSPDPMTWATIPYSTGATSVAMVATTATDVSGVEYYFINYTDPSHDSGWQDSPIYADTGLTPATLYSYAVFARDKSPISNTTAASAPKPVTTNNPPDSVAPTPDPMTWSVAPHGDSINSISMTATTATDDSGVEYYFTCTSGGGHDSGWQDGTTYVDSGLMEGATCSYTVKARDKSPAQNETAPSTPEASASALLDTTAPMPDPMTFDVAPAATGIDTITMTASEATDISGVEYFFQNTTDMSHFSGWQDNTDWTDTGLTNNTIYTYRVIARDKSLGQNETDWSEPNSATTVRYLCTGPITSDLSTDCRVDFLDYTMLAAAWSTPLPLTDDIAVNGTFETDITPGWEWLELPTAAGTCYAGFDGPPYGNPPGAAYVLCEMSTGDVDGYYFYQVIPVTPGQQYRFSGEWSGDLASSYSPDANSMSNHAEVVITFEPGTDPTGWSLMDPNSVMYRKSWGMDSQNTEPDGLWGWEAITASLANGPSNGIFTATAEYMVMAFTMGGVSSVSMPWIDIDNIKVEGPGCPVLELVNDCSLDFLDLSMFVSDWLTCNRNPGSECWQ
jgi:hypothetical protein